MAKDSFLDACLSAHRRLLLRLKVPQQNVLHVLLQPPPSRHAFKSAFEGEMHKIQDALNEVERVKELILNLEKNLRRATGQLQSLISPIGSLPVEVLRDILVWHVSLSETSYEEIDTLGAVCSFWRQVIDQERWLFSEANWNAWGSYRIASWCSRARGYPLAIGVEQVPASQHINIREKYQALHTIPNILIHTLSNPISNCTHLQIDVGRISNLDHLFQPEFPTLQCLICTNTKASNSGWIANWESILAYSISAPKLQYIKTDGVLLLPRSSSPSFSTLCYNLRYPHREVGDVIDESEITPLFQSPNVKKLVLYGGSTSFLKIQKTSKILDHLRHLELGIDGSNRDVWEEFSGVTFPSIVELRLFLRSEDTGTGRIMTRHDLRALSNALPNLETICIYDSRSTTSAVENYLADLIASESGTFPKLSVLTIQLHLQFLDEDFEGPSDQWAYEATLLQLLQSRNLAYLHVKMHSSWNKRGRRVSETRLGGPGDDQRRARRDLLKQYQAAGVLKVHSWYNDDIFPQSTYWITVTEL